MTNHDPSHFRSVTAPAIGIALIALLFACIVQHHTAVAEPSLRTHGIIAPNGVRCTGFMESTPGYSCYEKIAGRPGVRCSGYVAPGNHSALPSPPVIYSVTEIGKPGVPALTPSQLGTVRRIERAFGTAHLQFVLLPELVVFNATRGVCANWAGGYPMLNDNPDGRRWYEPGDNPYSTGVAPG